MNRDNKDELIAARKGSPVVIGIGKNEFFISSKFSLLEIINTEIINKLTNTKGMSIINFIL